MERFTPQQNSERHTTEHSAPLYVDFEDRPDGTYEKVSFLHEPIETYKDDLSRIEQAFAAKRAALADLERKHAAHAATDALAVLAGDLAGRIAMTKQAIERLEILHTTTQQRLLVLLQRDRVEDAVLDRMPTDQSN